MKIFYFPLLFFLLAESCFSQERNIKGHEGQEEDANLPAGQVGYKAIVIVSTKALAPSPLERAGGEVEIRVLDNGSGIPQNIVDKIFQPFFTTKPTGEGTGLGLSLAYDIIKAHGGEIKVETKQGEGSEFVICLPIRENVLILT